MLSQQSTVTFKQWKKINRIKTKEKDLVSFLKTCDDVCWGKTPEQVLEFARDYQVINKRIFDPLWAMENIERIDDLYVLWGYSEAYVG